MNYIQENQISLYAVQGEIDEVNAKIRGCAMKIRRVQKEIRSLEEDKSALMYLRSSIISNLSESLVFDNSSLKNAIAELIRKIEGSDELIYVENVYDAKTDSMSM